MPGGEVGSIRFESGREGNRIGAHHFLEESATTVKRTTIIIKGSAEADDDIRRLGHLDVDIGPELELVEIDVIVTALFLLQHAGILVEGAGDIVLGNLAATIDVEVGAMVDCRLPEQEVVPVVAGIHIRIPAFGRIVYF